jgi:multidrug resistance efflux pump
MKRNRLVRITWFLGLTLLLGTAGAAGVFLNRSHAGPESPSGRDAGPADEGVVCLGFVDVEAGVTSLYPVRSGLVTEVRAEENRSYPAGQLLLRVDPRLGQSLLEEARAELRLAREQLAQAEKLPKQDRDEKIKQQQLAIEAARRQWNAAQKATRQAEKLKQHSEISNLKFQAATDLAGRAEAAYRLEQAKLDELRNQDVMAKARLARIVVAAKETRVRQAELALEEFEVRAPVAGKVLRVLVNKGETLGSQPKQPAIQFLPDSKERIVRTEVQQEYAGQVKVGAEAVIEDDTRAGERWHGKVVSTSDWYTHRRFIIQEPMQQNDVRTLEAIVSITPRSGQALPRIGQRMRVRILEARARGGRR